MRRRLEMSEDASCADYAAQPGRASGGNTLAVSPEMLSDSVALAVRMHCLVRRKMTITALAQHAGMSVKRLQKLIDNDPMERRAVSGAELMSLMAVLGPAAASSVMALIGMSVEHSQEADAEPLGKMAAALIAASASLVAVASDGRVGRDEINDTMKAANEIMEQCHAFKAAAQRAKDNG